MYELEAARGTGGDDERCGSRASGLFRRDRESVYRVGRYTHHAPRRAPVRATRVLRLSWKQANGPIRFWRGLVRMRPSPGGSRGEGGLIPRRVRSCTRLRDPERRAPFNNHGLDPVSSTSPRQMSPLHPSLLRHQPPTPAGDQKKKTKRNENKIVLRLTSERPQISAPRQLWRRTSPRETGLRPSSH